MSIEGLPTPTPAAKDIALTGSAIVSDVLSLFVPGATTVHHGFSVLVERRLQKSQEIVLEAVRNGDIHLLSDREAAFAIPAAFRFFQAARDGEAVHNLRILADIIAGRIKEGKLDPADFLRLTRQLEGLSVSDLAALVAVYEVHDQFLAKDQGAPDTRDKELLSKLIPEFFENDVELFSSLSLLAGRGLMAPDRQTAIDADFEAYLPSRSLGEIMSYAENALARHSRNQVDG